jgi:hypothetical protein
MSRIIRPGSPARARASLLATLRETLAEFDAPGLPSDARDRLAFVVLSLRELEQSTEQTAQAWERRGYWVKVEQFRREWGWAGHGARGILEPLREGDLEAAVQAAGALRHRLPGSAAPKPRHAPAPWAGAYARLTNESASG